MRFGRVSLACGVLAAALVSAQDRPDFSGEWVLVEPSNIPGSNLIVVQNEQTIRIEAYSWGTPSFFQTPSSGTYGVRTVGGVVGPIPGDRTGVRWSWQAGTLVVTFEGGRLVAGASKQEVWSLDSRGRLAVGIATRMPNGSRTTTRWVYRKAR